MLWICFGVCAVDLCCPVCCGYVLACVLWICVGVCAVDLCCPVCCGYVLACVLWICVGVCDVDLCCPVCTVEKLNFACLVLEKDNVIITLVVKDVPYWVQPSCRLLYIGGDWKEELVK